MGVPNAGPGFVDTYFGSTYNCVTQARDLILNSDINPLETYRW